MSNHSDSLSLPRAVAAHRAAFGSEPSRAALAPGRVNLIGEHTDYNHGLVLPLAIQHTCAAVASPRADSRLCILAPDLPALTNAFECDLAAIAPAALRGTWMAYAAGPAALLFSLRRGTGADLTISSDVPLGAGLSSSAAVEVAVATVLADLWRLPLTPVELARICQRAEHEYAGVPCGLMDQLASVFGRDGHALLIDCRDNSITPVPLPPPDRAALIVTNSGVRHSLAAGEYAQRRAACESAARQMSIHSLRDATPAMIPAASLPPDQRACATHVITENDRVRAFADAIRSEDLAAAGKLMYASHQSLRDLYHVSCPELDTLVEIARSVPGVYGSRMTGGGFGGCTITLCDPAAVAPLTHALHTRYRAAHNRDCTVFPVIPSAGARLLRPGELIA